MLMIMCGVRLIALCTEAFFFFFLFCTVDIKLELSSGAPGMSFVDAIVPVSYNDF